MPALRAVDRPAGRAQPAQALAEDAQRVVAVLVDRDAERAHRRDRRLGVGRAAEARDPRLAVADRAEQHRAVRDRLVARHGDVPDERGCTGSTLSFVDHRRDDDAVALRLEQRRGALGLGLAGDERS